MKLNIDDSAEAIGVDLLDRLGKPYGSRHSGYRDIVEHAALWLFRGMPEDVEEIDLPEGIDPRALERAEVWVRAQWERLRLEFERHSHAGLKVRIEGLEVDLENLHVDRHRLRLRFRGSELAAKAIKVESEIHGSDTQLAQTIELWKNSPDDYEAASKRGWTWRKKPYTLSDDLEFAHQVVVTVNVAQRHSVFENDSSDTTLYTLAGMGLYSWGSWHDYVLQTLSHDFPQLHDRIQQALTTAVVQYELAQTLAYEERVFGVIKTWDQRENLTLSAWMEWLERKSRGDQPFWDLKEQKEDGDTLVHIPFSEPQLRPKQHGNQRWPVFDEFVLNWAVELEVVHQYQRDVASAIDERLHREFPDEMKGLNLYESAFDERELRKAKLRNEQRLQQINMI